MQNNTQIQIPSALKYEFAMRSRNKKREMNANFSITQVICFSKQNYIDENCVLANILSDFFV